MNPALLSIGILISFFGSLLAAVMALSKHPLAHRTSLSVLSLTSAVGAVAAVAHLIGGGAKLSVFSTSAFFGTVFTLDGFAAVFYATLCAIAALAAVYAMRYVELEREYHAHMVDFLTALFVFGMQGVLLANNPIGFLFFWEAMSMTSFFLVMAHKDSASMRAAIFYLIMTHLGAGSILAGFALVGNGNVTSSFATLAASASLMSPGMIVAAFCLFLFGFGSKAGLVPFHVWLPEAHPQAPSHVSALMSGVMLKIAVYAFLRTLFTFFPSLPVGFGIAVIVIGLLSAVYGVLYAIVERDVKRTLAFSSIENIGLIFTMIGTAMVANAIGLASLADAALLAALFQSVCHAVFKSGLFMGAGAMIQATGTRSLEGMGGLAARMPKFSFAMLVLALGACAMPPLGAFAGEWYFLQNVVQNLGSAPLVERFVLLGVLCGFAFVAGLAVYAMVKLYGIAFLGAPRSEKSDQAKDPSPSMLWPVAVCALLTAGLGIGAVATMQTVGSIISPSYATSLMTGPSGGTFTPGWVAVLLVAALALVTVARNRFSDAKNERLYHTWDCGQPITPHNQYSATAFSGPIRFMFRPFLRIKKRVEVTPLLATNPWVAHRELVLDLRSVWYDFLYAPILNVVMRVAVRVKQIQNGVIQVYIGLILLALVVTMLVAL